MAKPTICKKEFTVELGEDTSVTAEMNVVFVYDSGYGSDADGNRGMGVWFVDEVYPTEDITLDNNGYPLNTIEIRIALEKLEQVAIDHDWEELA